jgi:ABC-type nitrate/sulfonate/bicarbonate transport system substrate-binding protein
MKKWLVLLLAGVLVFSLAACSPAEPDPEQPQKVRVILDYLPNTNHTGLYVAQAKGYYAQQGLEVEIVQPSEGATATLIATGQGQFGISYQEDVTYARTAEEPLPIKAIATLIQHNTSGFASYKPKNITSPNDFEGKVYSGWGSPAEEAVIKAVMEKAGADFSTLSMVSGGDGGFAAMKDAVDLTWIFYGWTGIEAEMQDFPLNYIELRDLDQRLDYYTPVIIASEQLLKEDPELAQKFLAATKQGYMDAIEDPHGAADILAEAVPEYAYDAEFLRRSQEYLAPRYMADNPRWGEMKAEVWDAYTDFMREYGLIDKDMPAEEAFTNEFLPE